MERPGRALAPQTDLTRTLAQNNEADTIAFDQTLRKALELDCSACPQNPPWMPAMNRPGPVISVLRLLPAGLILLLRRRVGADPAEVAFEQSAETADLFDFVEVTLSLVA